MGQQPATVRLDFLATPMPPLQQVHTGTALPHPPFPLPQSPLPSLATLCFFCHSSMNEETLADAAASASATVRRERRRVQQRVVCVHWKEPEGVPEAGEGAALPEPSSSSALSRFMSIALVLEVLRLECV